MRKKTLITYSSLLALFSLIGVAILIINPSAKTMHKSTKHWREQSTEPYSKPILSKATAFEWPDQEPNGIVEAGTSTDAIKYEVRLDSNCAIDQCQAMLKHSSDFSDANNNPAQAIEVLINLKKIASYPKLQKDMNDFKVINLHDVLQSQIKLSLNQKMIEEINHHCAKRVYYHPA